MLKSTIRAVGQTGAKIAILFVWIYQITFSKIFALCGVRCRYYPSCSNYSKQAFAEFGLCKGVLLTAWRLLRCQPLGRGGFDPVVKKKQR